MNFTRDTNRLSAADLEYEATKDIAAADDARAASLDGLVALRSAKSASMAREKARLSAKLGADDPRVGELDAKIGLNSGLSRDAAIEAEHARIVPPEVDGKSWALHGFVRDADLAGVAGVTVGLYDASGKWLDRYGYVCADDRGYFVLAVKSLSNFDTGTTPPNATGSVPAFIHVTDRNRATLFVDKAPLALQPGTVEYRVIVLGAANAVCPPPDSGNTPGPDIGRK